LSAGPEAIVFRGLPNARIAADAAAVALLASDDCPATAGEIRDRIADSARTGVDPEDVIEAGSAYEVFVDWSRNGAAHTFDAAFVAAGVRPALRAQAAAKPWSHYVHHSSRERGALAAIWREHLAERLPSFMVPSAFVTLTALPMTPNGKIDRKALPEPDRKRLETASSYVAPESDLERVIADMWKGLLRLDRVGTDDNFFDIGANSLLMVQAHMLLREALRRPVSLVDLFRFPTVGSLARALAGGAEEEGAALVEGHTRAQARIEARNRRLANRNTADAR
jgi:acyl carrier protein